MHTNFDIVDIPKMTTADQARCYIVRWPEGTYEKYRLWVDTWYDAKWVTEQEWNELKLTILITS